MSNSDTELFNGQSDRRTSSRTLVHPEGVTPLFGLDDPPPRQWRIEDLVPDNHLTMLIGDGGTGKSFLALHLALCVASGRPFLGRDVRRGRVLYLDYELDENEQKRRTLKVLGGMGLDVDDSVIDNRIFHLSPKWPLGSGDHESAVGEIIRELDVDFVVVDSLTIGSTGDMKEHSDFNKVAQEIREWPTTLAIDHVSHSTAKKNSKNARAFGSVFKRNVARSSLTLLSKEDGYLLSQEKSNFTEGNSEIIYATEFGTEEVRFERIGLADKRANSFLDDFSTYEITLVAIKQIYADSGEPVSNNQIFDWREEKGEEVSEETIANYVSKLKAQGKIEKEHGKGAIPVMDDQI